MPSQSILPFLLEVSGSELMFSCRHLNFRHFQTISHQWMQYLSQEVSIFCLCSDWISWQLWLETTTGQLSCMLLSPSKVIMFGHWSIQKCVLKHPWDQDLKRLRHTGSFKNPKQLQGWAGHQVSLPWQIWRSCVPVERQTVMRGRTPKWQTTVATAVRDQQRRAYRSAVWDWRAYIFL